MPFEHVDPPFLVEHKPSACTHEGRRPCHLPCALDLLFVVQSYVYDVVLKGQPSFMDASGRHAVFSKLPKGYVHHCDQLERTHTVSPLVKEARTRCLVTLPHERDECQGQCITFHVGLDPRWRCSFTWTERPIKPTLRQSLTGVTVPG